MLFEKSAYQSVKGYPGGFKLSPTPEEVQARLEKERERIAQAKDNAASGSGAPLLPAPTQLPALPARGLTTQAHLAGQPPCIARARRRRRRAQACAGATAARRRRFFICAASILTFSEIFEDKIRDLFVWGKRRAQAPRRRPARHRNGRCLRSVYTIDGSEPMQNDQAYLFSDIF